MQTSTRILAGLCALALLGIVGAVNVYQQAHALAAEPDPYRIRVQAERFREVERRIPPGALVGYVSNQPFETVLGQAMFFGAQYTLAPRLLVDGPEAAQTHWILGNFTKPTDLAQVAPRLDARLAADLGSGVVLFERGAR